MTFLPIVERELRTAARRHIAHRVRLIAAGLALVIWFLLSVFGRNMTSPQRADAIFGTIGVLSLGFAMLAGAFLTADCLSEERREGTLGLLFLTDLKGHDVVLGKLASTSLHSIYGLLAVVPMLAVPLMMGGVTAGEFARTALVLLATLFLSLSAGMFVSAVSHDSRAAFLRTLGIMVTLSGVLPLLWWGQWILLRMRQFDFLLWASPGYALRCAGDSFYSTRSGAGEFWVCTLVIGVLGMLFLFAASVLLPRIWQQARDETSGRQTSPARLKQSMRSRVLLELHPYLWLATRDRRMGWWASRIIGIALLLWTAFYIHAGSGTPGGASFSITFLMAFALHVLFKCMVIAEATRRLSEDQQSGALELLLVTPLRPAEIMAGQRAALAQIFRWPKLMLVGMNLMLIGLLVWPSRSRWMGPDQAIFLTMFAGGIVLLFVDCFVICPAGVWSALTTKRHTRAIFATVRKILLPSWAAILSLWFLAITSNGLNSETVELLVVIWIAFGLAVDAVALTATTRRLNADFRELVATGKSSVKTSPVRVA